MGSHTHLDYKIYTGDILETVLAYILPVTLVTLHIQGYVTEDVLVMPYVP